MTSLDTQRLVSGVSAEGGISRPPSSVHLLHVSEQRSRWSHVADLDWFFVRVYQYHQRHGFVCMFLQQCLELCQFLFVVIFSLFLFTCIDYNRLFTAGSAQEKVSVWDVILPSGQCMSGLPLWLVLCLLVASLFWLMRAARVVYNCVQFWEIRNFYNSVLQINDCDLDNLTWQNIQGRLLAVQREHSLCIHKAELTELDIHNRILRLKNYMVALINKQVLPLQFSVPFVGDVYYLSRGLRYNLELLLFWGPGSPFENKWHLHADYKRVCHREALSATLARRTLLLALLNLVFSPVILLWQLLYLFYNYAELIKREPGVLGARCWSGYGRLFLRHFNELEHELNARLNRGYRAAAKYMSSFSSPLLEIVAKNVMFVSGAVLAALLLLAVYDEDVLTVEHVLTVMTLLGATVAVCRAFIADENLVFAPEQLLSSVLAHIHYMPDHWRGAAHTARTVAEFASFFQLKVYVLLEEALSPILTPLILIWRVRPVSLQLVDFYRNFTVEVVGVGDVCSFAQLDVRRHGDPSWRVADTHPAGDLESSSVLAAPSVPPHSSPVPADYGKTELSLMHFAINNPGWQPPPCAGQYISEMRAQGARECDGGRREGVSGRGPEAGGVVGHAELPLVTSLYNSGSAHLLSSLQEFPGVFAEAYVSCAGIKQSPGELATAAPPMSELSAAEMAASAIYLQQLHHRRVQFRRVRGAATSQLGSSRVTSRITQAEQPPIELLAVPPERQSQELPAQHHLAV